MACRIDRDRVVLCAQAQSLSLPQDDGAVLLDGSWLEAGCEADRRKAVAKRSVSIVTIATGGRKVNLQPSATATQKEHGEQT